MIPRPVLAALIGAGLLLASGCAPPKQVEAVPAGHRQTIGVYRGEVWDDSGRRTNFRLLLYARAPDHLHAELIQPVGGAAWILDAGYGKLSLTVVHEKVAYVGPADARTVAHLLGIAIDPVDLVDALIEGNPPDGGVAVLRLPAGSAGLPTTFELRDGARGFRLERFDTRPLATRDLATGTPPAGLRQVPLEELGVARSAN